MALQPRLPMLPDNAETVGPELALVHEGGRLTFYNASGPILSCREGDRAGLRMAAAVLSDPHLGLATAKALGKALGMHRGTVADIRTKYEQQGAKGLQAGKTGPRGPHRLKGTVLARAQKYLNEGRTNQQVAKMVGVSEGAIRYALTKGRLQRRDGAAAAQGGSEELAGPRGRSDEDVMAAGGVAVKRHVDRALARGHRIVEAEPEFRAAEAVRKAGVLLALPALVDQALFEVGDNVFGALSKGFFGLKSVLLTFALMALLRLRTINQLPTHSPGEFGLVLGLDRAPEEKTARRKLAELGDRGLARQFAAELARRWVDQEPDTLGYLYVDGHVRAYNGRKHTLPKTHVQRRRLCMPATTDYWVNDADAQPLMFITAEANDGLLSMLDSKILPEVRSLAGPDRRVTLIFDREGWSPKRFERWAQQGFDTLTYRKGAYEPWPEQCFCEVDSKVGGRKVTYLLGERSIRLGKTFWMREVRRLCDDGHQTSVMTTRQDVSIEQVARRMFSRWQQENFFRYMRHDFALDHMPTLSVEAADSERLVPNPARKAMRAQWDRARTQLAKMQEQYGQRALDNPESKRPTMRGFKIANGDLGKQIRETTARCQQLETAYKALPERVPIAQVLADTDNVRLERERKTLMDTIKMVAYRAETQLANLVGPLLPNCEDQARTFLKAAFDLPADLIPDHAHSLLRVRLHAMANPRSNGALQALCEVLNQHDVHYPGTPLRLVFEAP